MQNACGEACQMPCTSEAELLGLGSMVDAFMHPKLLISLSLVMEWIDSFTGSTYYSLPSLQKGKNFGCRKKIQCEI
jgi:hypothetical protein